MLKSVVLAQMHRASTPLFAVLDRARIGAETPVLELDSVGCLYSGKEATELGSVAPYLVPFSGREVELERLLNEGWGRAWGIYISSDLRFPELLHHLRKFVKVSIEGTGQEFYFRFYDPRVLRSFLPLWTPDQAVEFFGTSTKGSIVGALWMEGETPDTCIVFRHSGKSISREEFPLLALGR